MVDGAAGRLAERLRAEAGHVDEVSQARFERSLYEAWRTRGAADVAATGGQRARRPGVAVWGASVAVAAAAGALLAVTVFGDPVTVPANLSAAHYELNLGAGASQRGTLSQGGVLESGEHGHVDLAVGYSRVEMGRHGTLRLDRVAEDALELSLTRGRIEVAFHPPRKGVQTLAIETRTARVNVVGTRFSVEVDGRGNTDVVVTEGVVEVVSRADGSVRRVAAGQRITVQTDSGDAVERAVRDALTVELEGEQEAEAFAVPDMDFSAAADAPGPAGAVGEDAPAEVVAGRVEAPVVPVTPVTPVTRRRPAKVLASARELLRAGKHVEARASLKHLARSSARAGHRAEAHTLIAESFTAQGYVPRAEGAYRAAAAAAPGHATGHNALFALGRLLERYRQDQAGAERAYRDYLARAPGGALAPQATRALCRLGDAAHCK